MKRALQIIQRDNQTKRIKLERDSSDSSSSSDTESILSVQNKSTDFANDTEDTSASYVDEEEMQRIKCQRKYFLSTSEESEIQEIMDLGTVVANAVLDNNFDIGLHADTSEENSTSPTSNSDVDPGLPRSDYLDFEKCLICKTDKKDISYPYCNKCYKKKKTLFPPRPSRRKRKGSSKTKSESESVRTSESMASSQDSGCCSGSQGSVDLNEADQLSPKPTTSKSNDDNLCEICFERSRNGLFLHGNSCHLYGCYQCAKETWISIGACPLCRKKVKQVVRFLQPDMKNECNY